MPVGHAGVGTTQFGYVPVVPDGHDGVGTTQFGYVPVVPAGHTGVGTTQFGYVPVVPVGHTFGVGGVQVICFGDPSKRGLLPPVESIPYT